MNARLYLPQAWTDQPDRCRRAHVPEDRTFQTKPQIAIDLVDEAIDSGFRFQAVLGDAAYGRQTDLLEALEARQLPYVLAVPSSFSVRREEDVERARQCLTDQQKAQKTGRPRTRLKVEALIARLPESAWQTISLREGQPGARTKAYCRIPVYWGNKERVGSKVWLLAERPLPGDAGESKWFISNRHEASLKELAQTAHQRWHTSNGTTRMRRRNSASPIMKGAVGAGCIGISRS